MHQTTLRVRWGELDPYNHVNHAVYSSYLEHARVESLTHLDTGMQALAAQDLQIVVVRSDVRFRAPATAGDELVVTTSIGEMGAATMTWTQHIERGGERIVEAQITAACIDGRGKPVRIPSDVRSALSPLVSPHA